MVVLVVALLLWQNPKWRANINNRNNKKNDNNCSKSSVSVASVGLTGEAHNVIKEALLLSSNSNPNPNLQQLLEDDTTNGASPINTQQRNVLFHSSAITNTNPDSSTNTSSQNNKKTTRKKYNKKESEKLAQWSVLVIIVRKYFAQKTNFWMHYCNSRENFAAFNFLFDVSLLKIFFWLVVGCDWVFTVFWFF